MEIVNFFLPERYFRRVSTKNSFPRDKMVDILRRCFGMRHDESQNLMLSSPEGFYIECRPDQFTRFIIERYEAAECTNGIRDLKPQIIERVDQPEEPMIRVYNRRKADGPGSPFETPSSTLSSGDSFTDEAACIGTTKRPR